MQFYLDVFLLLKNLCGRGCNYVFLMFDSDSMVLLAPKDFGRSTIFYAWFLYQSELWLGREGVRKSGLIEKTVTGFVERCFILFYKQTQKNGFYFTNTCS